MMEIICATGLFFNIYLLNYLLKKEDRSNGRLLCYYEEIVKNKNLYNKDNKLHE